MFYYSYMIAMVVFAGGVFGLILTGVALDRMTARVDSMSATLAKMTADMEEREQAEKESDDTTDADHMSQESRDTRSADINRMLADMEERNRAMKQLMDQKAREKVLMAVGCRGKPHCFAW